MSQDVELWKRELAEAGWKPVKSTVWQSPDGTMHLGPYGAWVKMLGMRETQGEAMAKVIARSRRATKLYIMAGVLRGWTTEEQKHFVETGEQPAGKEF